MVLELDGILSLHKWKAINKEWKGLLGGSDEDDVFLAPDWLQTWWEVYGREGGYRSGKCLL
jgi:hypothetical protein